jgi:hypothetical protein
MDSTGLGMLASHYVRCQSKGIRLSIYRRGPSCSGIVQAHRHAESASDRLKVEA